jgi:hypothetical protein
MTFSPPQIVPVLVLQPIYIFRLPNQRAFRLLCATTSVILSMNKDDISAYQLWGVTPSMTRPFTMTFVNEDDGNYQHQITILKTCRQWEYWPCHHNVRADTKEEDVQT